VYTETRSAVCGLDYETRRAGAIRATRLSLSSRKKTGTHRMCAPLPRSETIGNSASGTNAGREFGTTELKISPRGRPLTDVFDLFPNRLPT